MIFVSFLIFLSLIGSTKQKLYKVVLDRYTVPDRAGAAMVSAVLNYMAFINDADSTNVIYRNKIKQSCLLTRLGI